MLLQKLIPVMFALISSALSAAARSGDYSLDKMPLKGGGGGSTYTEVQPCLRVNGSSANTASEPEILVWITKTQYFWGLAGIRLLVTPMMKKQNSW